MSVTQCMTWLTFMALATAAVLVIGTLAGMLHG
jgi:hypothetical protein